MGGAGRRPPAQAGPSPPQPRRSARMNTARAADLASRDLGRGEACCLCVPDTGGHSRIAESGRGGLMGPLQLASLGEPAARSRRALRGASPDARAKGSPRTAKRDQRFLWELEKPQARHFFPPTRPQPHRQLPPVPLPACTAVRKGSRGARVAAPLRSHRRPRTGRAGRGCGDWKDPAPRWRLRCAARAASLVNNARLPAPAAAGSVSK